MAEMKATSMRLSEEVKDKLREIVKSEGWENQDMALSKLISMYEIQQAKTILPDRRTEIDTVETHLKAISDIYFMSLQLNHDTEERIRQAYADRLESNQKTIQDLQATRDSIKNMLAISEEKAKQLEDSITLMNKDHKQALKQLETSEKLINEYKDKNDNLNGLLLEYKAYKNENKELSSQLQAEKENSNKLSTQVTDLQQQNKISLSELKSLKDGNKELSNQLQTEKQNNSKLTTQVFDLQQKAKIDILELKEKFSAEKDKLKEQHLFDREERNKEYRKLLDELNDLRQQNIELSKQINTTAATLENLPEETEQHKETESIALAKKRATRKKSATKPEPTEK